MDRIKRLSYQVLEDHKDKFGEDFADNKKALDQVSIVRSKGLKNEIAGYITKFIKKEIREQNAKQARIDAAKAEQEMEEQAELERLKGMTAGATETATVAESTATETATVAESTATETATVAEPTATPSTETVAEPTATPSTETVAEPTSTETATPSTETVVESTTAAEDVVKEPTTAKEPSDA